jgi:hypothetical protein
MDVVRDGPADADRLLIVSSACHGVEGYCGSGVQVAALADAEWREKARAQGVAVLYIHALNPYGFSHIRRVTQENVDLNRNFHDFSQVHCRKTPRTGTACSHLLLPATLAARRPPTNQALQLRLSSPSHGMPMPTRQRVTGGQHRHLRMGSSSAVTEPTWSNQHGAGGPSPARPNRA